MTISNPPEGYSTVTPYVVVRGLDAELEFLGQVFGARVHERLFDADGEPRHCEIFIGDSMIMLAESPGDDFPPIPASLYVYVDDVDAVHTRALEYGATEIMPPDDMFYGDRQGGFSDPAGNLWWVATRIENVSPDELQRRASDHWA